MDPKERASKLAKRILIFMALGAGYYVWIKLTDIRIPCLIHTFTGFYCPGCGGTRCFLSLMNLDLKSALRANAFMTVLLPFAAIYGIYKAVSYIITGKIVYSKAENAVFILVGLMALAFTVYRNIVDTSLASWHY